MRNLIVSVHVPKSGGTTFRKVLTSVTSNVYFDYDDKPLSADHEQRRIRNLANDSRRYLDIMGHLVNDDGLVAVHGHFTAAKYAQVFPDARFAIWFRDPVERLISNYHHWQREPDETHTLYRRMVDEKMSLAEFAAVDAARNVHARFMSNRPLEAFEFVGITGDYQRSLELFLKIFAPAIQTLDVAPRNVNPARNGPAWEVDAATRRMIETCNEEDLEIYKRAQERFRELCEAFAVQG